MKPSGRWPIVEFNGVISATTNETVLCPAKPGCFYVIGQLDFSVSGALLPVASYIGLTSNGASIFRHNGDASFHVFIQLPGLMSPIGGDITLDINITSTEVITYNGWAEVRG